MLTLIEWLALLGNMHNLTFIFLFGQEISCYKAERFIRAPSPGVWTQSNGTQKWKLETFWVHHHSLPFGIWVHIDLEFTFISQHQRFFSFELCFRTEPEIFQVFHRLIFRHSQICFDCDLTSKDSIVKGYSTERYWRRHRNNSKYLYRFFLVGGFSEILLAFLNLNWSPLAVSKYFFLGFLGFFGLLCRHCFTIRCIISCLLFIKPRLLIFWDAGQD